VARRRRRTYVDRNSPPSSYAVASLLEGEPGAIGRVVEATFLRTLFVIPGLYAATPLRGKQLLTAALAGSASITLSLMIYYMLRKNGLADGE
jgi:hypothetical protein